MNENLNPLCNYEMSKILYWEAVKPVEGSESNCFHHSINGGNMLMCRVLLPQKCYLQTKLDLE